MPEPDEHQGEHQASRQRIKQIDPFSPRFRRAGKGHGNRIVRHEGCSLSLMNGFADELIATLLLLLDAGMKQVLSRGAAGAASESRRCGTLRR